MMTAWALICEVWYLPPMHKKDDENAIKFARRCQRAIARRGGLVDLGWDGNLKRSKVPERLKREQRELFFHYLAETTPICECASGSTAERTPPPLQYTNNEIHPIKYGKDAEGGTVKVDERSEEEEEVMKGTGKKNTKKQANGTEKNGESVEE